MKTSLTRTLLLACTVLLLGSYRSRGVNNAAKDTPQASYEDDDDWYSSVKGHYHPDSLENNETQEMWTEIWWNSKKGKGKVELVPALKALGENGPYVDIHTNEPWELEYEGYGDCMWYFQIDCCYKVVEPLFLNYYFNPHFVYEGDLDQDTGCS